MKIPFRIETTIEFPDGFSCKRDALGQEYEIIIGKHKGVLAFPNIPDDYLERIKSDGDIIKEMNLTSPNNSDIKLQNGEKIDWGFFFVSDGTSYIKHCSIWFPCTYRKYKKVGEDVAKKTKEYIDKFILFLEIISENAFNAKSGIDLIVTSDKQYWTWNSKNKIIPVTNVNINVDVSIIDNFVTKNMIEEALNYCNNKYEPNTSYCLLRDSIYHSHKKDFRRAIIDSTTAIEIALTRKIKKELQRKKINDNIVIDALLEKYNALGGRYKLARKMKIELPRSQNDYLEVVGKARNKAVHAGYVSNISEVRNVIEITSETLKSLCEFYE